MAGKGIVGDLLDLVPGATTALQTLKSTVPVLEDEATVEVVGQPGASKKDLYYLALAAAFGLVRRFDFMPGVLPPVGMVMLEYDAADNWVRCVVRYRTNMISARVATASLLPNFLQGTAAETLYNEAAAYVNSVVGVGRTPLSLYAEAPVYAGPRPDLVGAPFEFVGALGVGLPLSPISKGAPVLPFANKTILTTAPVVPDPNPAVPTSPASPPPPLIPSPNPLPPGDARSRGAVVSGFGGNLGEPWTGEMVTGYLVPLVFAALSDPGSTNLQTFPVPGAGALNENTLKGGG